MTLTVLLGLATIVTAIVFATYAARACRDAHDIARSLGANGTDIRQIVRRTGLQQDVVSMLLAGVHGARQNIPVPAGTSRRTGQVAARNTTTRAQPPVMPQARPSARPRTGQASPQKPAQTPAVAAVAARAARATRGTDVATA